MHSPFPRSGTGTVPRHRNQENPRSPELRGFFHAQFERVTAAFRHKPTESKPVEDNLHNRLAMTMPGSSGGVGSSIQARSINGLSGSGRAGAGISRCLSGAMDGVAACVRNPVATLPAGGGDSVDCPRYQRLASNPSNSNRSFIGRHYHTSRRVAVQ